MEATPEVTCGALKYAKDWHLSNHRMMVTQVNQYTRAHVLLRLWCTFLFQLTEGNESARLQGLR
eukprot:15432065-Alexandrium_andersonii.AAC.1